MLAVMRDMVIAGGDTVNNAMEFAVYYMAVKPEIQEKVRDEIDHVIGASGRPTYAFKDRYYRLLDQPNLLTVVDLQLQSLNSLSKF